MNNIGMLIQLLKNGGNPQQMAMSMLQQMGTNNPIAQNLSNMIQSGNVSGAEQIARNICASKGINPDELAKQVKDKYGL